MGIIRKITGLVVAGFFGIGFVVLASITILPATAHKPNMLGYYGVCSFAPVSTMILFVLSAVFILLGRKLFKSSVYALENAIPVTALNSLK